MKIEALNIDGAFKISPEKIGDERGGFARLYCSEIFKKNALKIKNPDMIFPGQVFDLPVLREKINYER